MTSMLRSLKLGPNQADDSSKREPIAAVAADRLREHRV